MVSLGYIGQHGTHLVVPMPYFQRQLLPNGGTLPSPYLSGNPLLSNIAQISGTEANGNLQYDSLQVTLRDGCAGLEYQLAYTWSKLCRTPWDITAKAAKRPAIGLLAIPL